MARVVGHFSHLQLLQKYSVAVAKIQFALQKYSAMHRLQKEFLQQYWYAIKVLVWTYL